MSVLSQPSSAAAEKKELIDIAMEMEKMQTSQMEARRRKIWEELHDARGYAECLAKCIARMLGRADSNDIDAFERESVYYRDQCAKLVQEDEQLARQIRNTCDQAETLRRAAKAQVYTPLHRELYDGLKVLSREQLSRIHTHMKLVEAQINATELCTAGMETDSEIECCLGELAVIAEDYYFDGEIGSMECSATFNHLWLIRLTFSDLSAAEKGFQRDRDTPTYHKAIASTHLSVVMEDMKTARMFD